MAKTYNWIISSMKEYPKTSDGLNDVVFVVSWGRSATEVVGDITYYADKFGELTVPAPSPENFTPYANLTFEQVCGWLEEGLDVSEIDAVLDSLIEVQKNPPVVELRLPWLTTTTIDIV